MSDFHELEIRIRALGGEPPDDLRARVLRAVTDELDRPQPSLKLPPAIWYWPAIAALLAVVVNLSYVAASDNAFSLHRGSFDPVTEIGALRAIESQQEGLLE